MTVPGSVTVDQFRQRATRLWEREGRKWAAGDSSSARIDIPLHPPTQAVVLGNYAAVTAWVDSWRSIPSSVTITWEPRRWGSVGTQNVPARARVQGPGEIAGIAGAIETWQTWQARAAELREALAGNEPAQKALTKHIRSIGELSPSEFIRLRDVTRWVLHNPHSGKFVRELPIRGIHTKWLEDHLSIVTDLLGRSSLDLRQAPHLVRLRALDPALAPAELSDLTAPIDQVSALDLDPDRIVIVENQQSFLALPEAPGTIAINGQGNSAPLLAQIDWVQQRPCLYWGDIDTHGFRILSQARGAGLDLQSVLMDTDTLLLHRDLWVPEGDPHRQLPANLSADEVNTFLQLGEQGGVRLEQERIDWHHALYTLASV